MGRFQIYYQFYSFNTTSSESGLGVETRADSKDMLVIKIYKNYLKNDNWNKFKIKIIVWKVNYQPWM